MKKFFIFVIVANIDCQNRNSFRTINGQRFFLNIGKWEAWIAKGQPEN
jgi:hypothetical protein